MRRYLAANLISIRLQYPRAEEPELNLFSHSKETHPPTSHQVLFKMASSQTAAKKDDKSAADTKQEQTVVEQKPAVLEEDDEFEDFPVDGTCKKDNSLYRI